MNRSTRLRWGVLSCLLLAGTARGLAVVPVTLVKERTPAELTVQTAAGNIRAISVEGVRAGAECSPASPVLHKGERLSLLWIDPAHGRAMVLLHRKSRLVDYGLWALRRGLVVAEATPGWPLSAAYENAQGIAQAQGTGVWQCSSGQDKYRSIAVSAGIPSGLLYSVALTESGWHGKPWPWTLNWRGVAVRYRSRRALYRAARILSGRGYTRFDIGPMQVDWKYQGHRFGNLWNATDPWENVEVGAQILQTEFKRAGTWPGAVARYHDAKPSLGRPYMRRVLRHYRVLADSINGRY